MLNETHPVKYFVMGKQFTNDSSTPIVESKFNSSVYGVIDMYIHGLTGAVTLDTSIYKILAPTGYNNVWIKQEPRLDTTDNISANYSSLTSNHQRIDWRLNTSAVTGTSQNNTYGLSFAINEGADITGTSYTPDLIVKINNTIG